MARSPSIQPHKERIDPMSNLNGAPQPQAPSIVERELAALIGAAAVESTKLKVQLRMANAVIEQQARQIAELTGAAKSDAAADALAAVQTAAAKPRPRRVRDQHA